MEANENETLDVRTEEPVSEQTETVSQREDDTEMTEEEMREILSVFAETNENRHRRSGIRMTLRNQLIIVGSILALAGILLSVYFLFLQEEPPMPAFYTLRTESISTLEALDTDVEITFCSRSQDRVSEEDDPQFYRIYTFATLYEKQNKKVDLVFAPEDLYKGVRIRANGKTKEIPYADFYSTRPFDGLVYGFNGESLYTNTILELLGKETVELEILALPGFDTDGDEVLANGNVVMFPKVDRSNIAVLTVNNPHGQYTVLHGDGDTFYFQGSETLNYDAERFASLLVDCRYVVTAGKVKNQLALSAYGLDEKEKLTCSYTLLTLPDASGYLQFYQIWIGNPTADGRYYYALCFGGRMTEDQEKIESTAKPLVYLVPAANVENNLTQPVETFFKAQLVGGISSINEINQMDQFQMEYFFYDEEKQDISMKVLSIPVINFSDNTSSNNSDGGTVLSDKKSFADSKNAYTDWTGTADSAYLVGLNSSDKKPFSVYLGVKNIASDGVYTCSFGALLDTNNKKYAAILPEDIAIRYTTDGENYTKVTDHGLRFDGQEEGTVKNYSFKIQSDEPILKIELTFTMPDRIGYFVVDEFRIYADGADAMPKDALSGLWRLVSPKEYIPAGTVFTYLDSTNFNAFQQGLVMLEGDSVAAIGISKRGEGHSDDIIDMEKLAPFGLDRPAMHFSYVANEVLTDVYVSAYDEENGCYYAYSTITGDAYNDGTVLTFCTGIVARILPESAEWLGWDSVNFIDHSLVGMYVYDIRRMEVTMGGKTYTFNVRADDKKLTSVMMGDTELDEENFRYFYLSIVRLNMKDAYVAQPGDNPTEYMRIRIKTETDEKEYVFYRVSSSRAYYTVNGDEAKYYCLFRSLKTVGEKLGLFVSGQPVGR